VEALLVTKDSVFSVVAAQESAIDNASVARILQTESGEPIDVERVRDCLEHDYRIVGIEEDRFYSAGKLADGVCFFALPEARGVEEGKVGLFGGEMLFFLKSALGRDTLELETEQGSVSVSLSIEEADYFLIRGLRKWYKETGFVKEQDALLFTIIDYENARFRIRRLPSEEFDRLLDSELPFEVTEYVATLFREHYEDGGDLADPLQITSILKIMLYREVFNFFSLPCNLSFYLSDSERFFVSGNRVQLASEIDEDFSPFYLGGTGEIPTSLKKEDLNELEEALTLLFIEGEPRKAASVLKALKLKYPSEKILNKFLYQASYFLEIDEDILFYAAEYSEAFPSDPDPFRTQGEVCFKQGDYEKAGEYFNRALQLIHPQDKGFLGEVYMLWMYLKWETGDEAAAVRMAEKALDAVPDNEEILEFLEETGYAAKVRGSGAHGRVIKVDFRSGRKKQ